MARLTRFQIAERRQALASTREASSTTRPSRTCEVCERREVDAPRLGGITRFLGLWAHPSCYRKAAEAGALVHEKGKATRYVPPAR